MTVNDRSRSSAATKAAILAAARERFAAEGYEKATIRAVAADAGIDPAQVMRYFGNKAGLFAAAADFELRVPDLRSAPRAELGRLLAAHFVDRWEQDDAFTALLRASITHDVAADRLRAVVDTQVADVVAQVTADAAAAPVRGAMIASQVLGVAVCRYILRLPPLAAMPRAELVERLGATIHTTLEG